MLDGGGGNRVIFSFLISETSGSMDSFSFPFKGFRQDWCELGVQIVPFQFSKLETVYVLVRFHNFGDLVNEEAIVVYAEPP